MLWMIRGRIVENSNDDGGEEGGGGGAGDGDSRLDICYARTNNRRKNNNCFYKRGIRLRAASLTGMTGL